MRGMYFLSHRKRDDWIGVVHGVEDGVIRLRKFDRRGPLSHFDYHRDGVGCYSILALANEIEWDWVFDPTAAERLIEWQASPEWELGLQGMVYLLIWNELTARGEFGMARKLDCLSRKLGIEALGRVNEIGLRILRFARLKGG